MEELLTTKLTEMKKDLCNFFEKEIKGLRSTVDSIDSNQQFISDSYEEIKAKLEELLTENQQIKAENIELRKTVKVLEKKVLNNESTIDDLEQYGRREMIEIEGFPAKANENIEDLVIKIAAACEVKITPDDIEAAHRVKSRTKTNLPIIVKFKSRKTKQGIMANKKKLSGKKTSDFGYPKSDFFVNESLTQRNKNLLRLTRLKRKEKGYRYAWSNNGNVFARKDAESIILAIKNEEDLSKIK